MLKNLAYGQCVIPGTRIYASGQQTNPDPNILLASVDNAGNAADGNPATYATLNRLVGVGALITTTEYLKFTNPDNSGNPIPAGTPVTIKLSIPAGLISLLNGVEIQPFTNLRNNLGTGFTWQATAAGAATTSTDLLGLISGAGDAEFTITPTANFNGVWIRLQGVAIGQSLKLYDAYIMQPGSSGSTSGCNTAVDAFSGAKASTALGSVATALGTVANPLNAIDNDPDSYAEIDAVANALSKVYHTTIFSNPSQPGDTIKMVVQNSGSGLLDVGVLDGFLIQLYSGNTQVGGPINGSSSNLRLNLFPDASQKYELDFIAPAGYSEFDRIEVSVGGLATLGLIQGLKIYDVRRSVPKPVVNGTSSSTQTVCQGNTSTFTVSNAQTCTTYSWYDAETGGTLLQSDPLNPNYTPPATLMAGDHQFYVEAKRTGCTEITTRAPAVLKVNPLPTIVTTGHPKVCVGGSSTTMAYTTTNSASTYSIVWDTAAHTGHFTDVTDAPLPASTDITVTVPTDADPATYNGQLTVKNASGCISSQQPFSIDVDAKPSSPVISLTP